LPNVFGEIQLTVVFTPSNRFVDQNKREEIRPRIPDLTFLPNSMLDKQNLSSESLGIVFIIEKIRVELVASLVGFLLFVEKFLKNQKGEKKMEPSEV
jgi:hypothetical protein